MSQDMESGCKAFTVEELARWIAAQCGGVPQGIVFDCDGVIIDSSAANLYYYNLLRKELGLPELDEATSRYVQMSTAQQAIDAIIPRALMPALGEVTRRLTYRDTVVPLLRPTEGIHDFLRYCQSRGIRMAVHTNRRDGMPDVVRVCHFEGFFDPVITVNLAKPKPDPDGAFQILKIWDLDAAQTLFIGDSSTDRDAANGASIPFLPYRNTDLRTEGYCEDFVHLSAALEMLRQAK